MLSSARPYRAIPWSLPREAAPVSLPKVFPIPPEKLVKQVRSTDALA